MKNMKKIIQTIIFALGAIFTATAQDNSDANDCPGWLWEISGNGLAQKSYLFGTCHGDGHRFTREEVFSITGMEEVLAKVEAVLFEGGMNTEGTKVDTAETRRMMAEFANPANWVMPDGVSYEQLFDSVEHFNELHQYLTIKQKDSKYYQKNPRFWHFKLTLDYLGRNANEIRVDDVLKQETLQRGLEVGYVEKASGKAQSSILNIFVSDTTSLKEQAERLYNRIHVLNQIGSNDSVNMDFVARTYLENDTVTFESLTKIIDKVSRKGAAKEVLEDRSVAWIPVIKENLAKRPCMIAVGCRHLLGYHGLIALLRREGYTVEAVK